MKCLTELSNYLLFIYAEYMLLTLIWLSKGTQVAISIPGILFQLCSMRTFIAKQFVRLKTKSLLRH